MAPGSMPRSRRRSGAQPARVSAAAAIAAWVLAFVAAACAIAPSPAASSAPTLRPLGSGELPVRTVEPAPSGHGQACAGVGFDAVLHGSPGDPVRTWIVYADGGRTDEVIWPAGYSARFTP
ncbi:MAG TPA: hypothetical protein VFR93_11630, partial [Candidatus Limnocylindrales bacterium]|nr:hypothetical protein [Candidatus Limnocylindrales bacterium]